MAGGLSLFILSLSHQWRGRQSDSCGGDRSRTSGGDDGAMGRWVGEVSRKKREIEREIKREREES